MDPHLCRQQYMRRNPKARASSNEGVVDKLELKYQFYPRLELKYQFDPFFRTNYYSGIYTINSIYTIIIIVYGICTNKYTSTVSLRSFCVRTIYAQ